MRILHVFDHSIPLQSGYTFRSASILREQRRLGWETYHVTGGKHAGDGGIVETVDGLDFFRTAPTPKLIDQIPIVNQLAISHSLYRRLCEVIEEVRPDILHAHSPVLNGLAALRAARKFSIPVVYEIRAFWEDAAVDHGTSSEGGFRYKGTRALETYVAKRVDWVTTICDGLQMDLCNRGLPSERITVVPNAVNLESFPFRQPRDSELDAKYDLEGKIVLGFVGSFYHYEGIGTLVEAMPEVTKALPEARLLLVGGGPCYEDVQQSIQRLGIEESVICTGRVPHSEVSRYYSLIDVFCYPRLPMRLTNIVTPLKPLEAMAMGKVIIASDVGGHQELINDNDTGYLFQAGSREQLAEAVIRTVNRRSDWDRLIGNGRDFVERIRNWKNSVSNYESIYTRLAS